jgi:hypothetical protein
VTGRKKSLKKENITLFIAGFSTIHLLELVTMLAVISET